RTFTLYFGLTWLAGGCRLCAELGAGSSQPANRPSHGRSDASCAPAPSALMRESEDMMKANRVYRFGSPEVISFEDVGRPEPSNDEVVVRVSAAGVGPWDSWIR